MIVKSNCLVIKRKSLELIIEEEIDSLFIKLQSQAFKEWDIVIDKFIIVTEIKVMYDQLIKERMGK